VRAAVALAAVVAFTTWARQSHATPSAKLVYVREAGTSACPAESDLRKAVASRIGYDPFFPTASKTVVAQISRVPSGYRGKVQIVGDDGLVRGSRDLSTRGDDCSELLSALALAISIALDDLDDGKPPPVPAGEGTDAAAPSPPPPPTAAPDASPPPEPRRDSASSTTTSGTTPRLGFLASAGPTVSVGFAPAPSVGASLSATLRYSLLAARFALRADLPASGDLTGGGSVSASSVLATASACIRGDVPFVCAGGGVGSFATTTAGVHTPASDTALLATVLVSGGVDVPLWRQLYLEPFVEGSLVLTRHRVVVDGVEGYRLPGFAGTGEILLGWRFL